MSIRNLKNIGFILLSIFFLTTACSKDKSPRRKIKLAPNEITTHTISSGENSTVIKFDAEERVSIAVLTFENMTTDTSLSWLCQGITDMLIRDLSQSRYLKVMTMQRIYDILKKMSIDSPCAITYQMMPTISREAEVEAILRGSFTNFNDSLLIDVQLYNARNGRIIQEQRVAGMGLAQIFGMVDELSQKIKYKMRINYRDVSDNDLDLVDISTNSWEAYKYYSEGVSLAYKAYFGDAIRKFEQAIQLDSSFAMAQYWAGLIYTKLGQSNAAQRAIRSAMENADHTTALERMKIEWLAAANRGEYQEAFEKMQAIVEAFPDDKVSHYQLAGYHYIRKELELANKQLDEVLALDPDYAQAYILQSAIYRDNGDYQKAIDALKQCIKLNPKDASPYHNLGELFETIGDYDQAIKAYQQAIKLKPDFHFSVLNLAHTYSTIGDYSQAVKTYQHALAIVPSEQLKAEVYSGLAQVEMLQGKYKNATQHIRRAMKFPTSAGEKASYLAMLAGIYLRNTQYDSTIAIAKRALLFQSTNIAGYHTLAQAYAESGDLDSARDIAHKIDLFINDSKLELYRNIYWRLLSKIAAAEHNYPQAIQYLQNILDANPNAFSVLMDLGKYYTANNQQTLAIESFKSYIDKHGNQVPVFYYLALAYKSNGQDSLASKALETFLNRWKEADNDIPEIVKAHQLKTAWENDS
ncbi:tetratricopeptide repeat protein [candidate division KSB1 bacterium]|nr:tetratricopeptide repeat protein [candidate division KSB1 bacterium]